jgi:release factor glutamine methyltransferase
MTTGQFLREATAGLKAAGIDSARLDILLLLEDCLQIDRAYILAHPELTVPGADLTRLEQQYNQRKEQVPVAYLTHKAHFYGQAFYVDKDVLVPRPESESIITLLLALPLPAAARIADIGTGSGCLGITAALEIPGSIVTLCDISEAALRVAVRNCTGLTANCSSHVTDLLTGCPMPQDVLLANLPYVPDNYPINAAAQYEPEVALFAGTDGLEEYRRLWQQVRSLADKPLFVITESLEMQHEALQKIAEAAGYKQKGPADGLAQLFAL